MAVTNPTNGVEMRAKVRSKLQAKRARRAARALIDERGMRTLARDIGVSTEALSRWLAELPVMRGTSALIESWLAKQAG